MLEILTVIVYFTIVNTFLFAIFSIPFVAPIVIRSWRLKRLAAEYGLSFESRLTKDHTILARKDTSEKNIISGVHHGNDILISDILSYTPIPIYTTLVLDMRPGSDKNSYSLTKRTTHVFINGIERQIARGKLNGYSSVRNIRNILCSI